MNKNKFGGIERAFDHGKAFIAFVTGGDPDIETTKRLLPAIEKAGADLIEIGLPFSDPVAEGIVIQEANERALGNGATTDKIFDMVKEVREEVTVPIVFLTYLNPIFTYGTEIFMERCRDCGVEGLIIPDMPFEEKGELKDAASNYGIALIPLIAPTSNDRIQMIAKEGEGFIYCVSSLGVTGVRSEIQTDIKGIVTAVKEATDVPCAIGFGIALPSQAKEMASISDGAIVGSAIVKLAARYGKDCIEPISEYVYSMKKAILEL